MDMNAYLKRMNYTGPLDLSAETLRQLHRTHMMSVPFENLSIGLKQPILLNDNDLFQKIVLNNRGGFCYELNGLFASLLRELGFNVAMLSAGVAGRTGGFGSDFDHMTLRVRLDEDWLADVGFGDLFLEPILLKEGVEQKQENRTYRISSEDNYLVLNLRDGNEVWKPQYRFTLEPHKYEDFAAMCLFHQTSPESHFTQHRLCSIATPEGRITISNKRLIITRKGIKEERELTDEPDFTHVLQNYFGITKALS